MRDCQSGGTREKIAAPPLSANNQPLPDPTLCSSQSLICSWESLCSCLEWRCQWATSPSTIPAEAHGDSQEKLHTHRVCKFHETWGFRQPCATCLVWAEPSRTCLVQLDCRDRHSRAPGPAKPFRATHGHSVPSARWFTSMSYPMTGSPCHCTPVHSQAHTHTANPWLTAAKHGAHLERKNSPARCRITHTDLPQHSKGTSASCDSHVAPYLLVPISRSSYHSDFNQTLHYAVICLGLTTKEGCGGGFPSN